MALKFRYVFGEAWSIARSGPRQTLVAVALVALALYIPGLLLVASGNLARLMASEGEAPTVVLTLGENSDVDALAQRARGDTRIARVVIVTGAAALERFRRTYPDLGSALAGLKESPFPSTLEIF